MTNAALAAVGPIVLPASLGLRRDPVARPENRGPDHDAAYDHFTLAYDTVHSSADGCVRLFCPKLFNLASVLREAEVRLDGRPAARPRVRRHRRHDVIEIVCRERPAALSTAWRDWRSETPVQSDADAAAFAGRNAFVTLSRALLDRVLGAAEP